MKRLLHIALASCLIGLFAVPMSGQENEEAEKKKKPKISGAAWKKIGNLTKKKRSFQVEKATTVAGVRGAEAEDEVLKHLYYRGGTAAPSRLELKNAIEILEKDIRMNPDGEDAPESLYFIGQCYEELGATDDAKLSYSRLIKEYAASDYVDPSRERLTVLGQ